jgi:hypothetical protein
MTGFWYPAGDARANVDGVEPEVVPHLHAQDAYEEQWCGRRDGGEDARGKNASS